MTEQRHSYSDSGSTAPSRRFSSPKNRRYGLSDDASVGDVKPGDCGLAPNVQGREAAPDRPTLHERLVAKGVVVSHYRDCLYVPDSDRARLVIVEFVRDGREVSVSRFESRAGRTVWLEIPGHYGSFATSPSSRP